MKRATFLTAIAALSLPVLQAAPVSQALADGTCLHAPQKAKAKQPKAADKPTKEAAAEPAKPAAEEPKPAQKEEAADKKATGNSKAIQTCERIRKRMAEAEKALASLSKPSRSLSSRCENTKRYVNGQLERMEASAVEISELQAKLERSSSKSYEFTIVPEDQRNKYVQDGTAAHKAMLADMKEDKNKRKIKGLDKFEIMRDRYQGMPEYKEAEAWYVRTLMDLEKNWTNLQAKEEKRREKLPAAKRQKMEEDDEKAFTKLEKQLQAENEDIAQYWYKPDPRNLRMLGHSLNKVKDALRRRESANRNRQSEKEANVPELLVSFWENMDKARNLMVSGDLEGANELLENDETFNRIVQLPRNVLPDEYRDPLREQRQHMMREIKTRESEIRRTANELERKLSNLDRESSSVEARIDSLMEDIMTELDADTGHSDADDEEEEEDTKAKPDDKAKEKADDKAKDKGKGKGKKGK